jgi:MSHA biogenesis protein MshK
MALLAASWAATGEELPDPTRPAVDLGGGQGGAATEAEMSAQRPKEGLQTIIIAPGHRLAVINGQTVPLGGSYAGAKLVEIREDSVVLQGAQGTKIMELFPKVNIRKNKSASQAGVSKPEDGTGTGEQPEAVGGKK